MAQARDELSGWLYVSQCALPDLWVPRAVDDIVATSTRRNGHLGVTGALLFTGQRFVQFLEGPAGHVAQLRASILADTRHRQPITLLQGPRESRLFTGWRLAYTGPSLYVHEKVMALLDNSAEDAETIIHLLREFTLQASGQAPSGD